ncbi:fimbrial protein [Burkholderia arboris]|uniref:fimbrial protein n=1 Tax=Burkholderia arboris TaxID=488730 RepID=UPI001CF598C2|nr:fimbrial protein [Burkholderia arboris]MCA8037553.1 fimbrial protein [Burkholderia arboris]
MKILIVATCFCGLFPAAAWALCTQNTSNGLNYYTASVSGFSPPDFSPGDVPIGGVIYSASGKATFTNKKGSVASSTCNSWTRTYLTGVGVPDSTGIYPTSMPNIGIRLKTGTGGKVLPYQEANSYLNSTWNESFALTVELVKTGEITAGGVLSDSYAQYRADQANGQVLVDFRFASPVLVRPRVPTCKVATPLITVPMGKLGVSSFNGVGSTVGTRSFAISLACSGGDAGTMTNAYVTLTDSTMPSNMSTTLSLTKESTASGVGLQIMKGDTLVGFGPDSAAVGNTNQWKVGTVMQGQANLTIPLTARYVQTGSKITPGSANARATFTMSYQ